MDFFNLRWLCFAVFFIPLAVNAGKVSTDRVVGTTSYAVKETTISKPSNTTFSPVRDLNPKPSVQRLPSGGLSQSASGNLYIAQKNGSRLSTPVKGAFNFAKNNLKSGAKNLLKRNPMAFAGTVGLMGLDKLLRDHGWEPYDGGLGKPFLDENGYEKPFAEPSSYDYSYPASQRNGVCGSLKSSDTSTVIQVYPYGGGNCAHFVCPNKSNGFTLNGSLDVHPDPTTGIYCTYGSTEHSNKPKPSPVTDTDIDQAVDSNYEPTAEDWPLLFPYISPDSFTIDSIPSVRTPSTISTSTSTSSGITTTTESFTDFDFDFDNSTDTPSITVTETETEIKYENGDKVDETTTTVTNQPSAPLPDSGGSGSGDKPPPFELPSFCSWASTVCNWIGWTQEMPDGEEPDLSRLLTDYDFEQTNTISFGSKQCPEPITLNLILINQPLKISFDAFCSLAGYLYYMVMASAYIIAARITLGVARG